MISYNNKSFRSVENTPNGEVSGATRFYYKEAGNLVTATYEGGSIVKGQLIAIKGTDGSLDMRYHHVNIKGELMTGICKSVPEVLPNGKIRLYEKWKWTSGNNSEGESIIEEE